MEIGGELGGFRLLDDMNLKWVCIYSQLTKMFHTSQIFSVVKKAGEMNVVIDEEFVNAYDFLDFEALETERFMFYVLLFDSRLVRRNDHNQYAIYRSYFVVSRIQQEGLEDL